jgi:purine-nucleoside phosphorylase
MSKIGIILGSGLNNFENEINLSDLIFKDESSFHKLKAFSGKISGENVVLFSGRRHFYEGFKKNDLSKLIEIAKDNKVKLLIITNAAGGINNTFEVSDLMLLTSHIQFHNKFIFNSDGRSIYRRSWIDRLNLIAIKNKIKLRNGTYCWTSGPMYETVSEMKFLKKIGVDAIGMSTVPEILYSNSLGINTIAISCITNLLSEDPAMITSHEDVIKAGKKAYPAFSRLIKSIIENHSEFI